MKEEELYRIGIKNYHENTYNIRYRWRFNRNSLLKEKEMDNNNITDDQIFLKELKI